MGTSNRGNGNTIRSQAWDRAIHAYATSFVFQRRGRVLKVRLQWLTYIGLVVPLIIGGLVLAYGAFSALSVILIVGSAIGIAQVAVSLWSIVGGWVDAYSYAPVSAAANESLSTRFAELGQNPPADLTELQHRYEKLQIEDDARRDQDHQKGINEAELRMGMRAALRKFQRTCAGCDVVPTSMKPTDCGVCGDFKYSVK